MKHRACQLALVLSVLGALALSPPSLAQIWRVDLTPNAPPQLFGGGTQQYLLRMTNLSTTPQQSLLRLSVFPFILPNLGSSDDFPIQRPITDVVYDTSDECRLTPFSLATKYSPPPSVFVEGTLGPLSPNQTVSCNLAITWGAFPDRYTLVAAIGDGSDSVEVLIAATPVPALSAISIFALTLLVLSAGAHRMRLRVNY